MTIQGKLPETSTGRRWIFSFQVFKITKKDVKNFKRWTEDILIQEEFEAEVPEPEEEPKPEPGIHSFLQTWRWWILFLEL